MEAFSFLNNAPIWLGILYICVELYKEISKRRHERARVDNENRNELTDSIFKLYGIAKEDLEKEKEEIRELTRSLKRANLEIAILERKVAALMRVLDTALGVPEIDTKYKASMARFAQEAEVMKNELNDNE